MGSRWVVLVVAIIGWLAAVTPAHAGKHVAAGEVHAEVDVVDQAGAVTLLVHTALAGPDVTLVAVPAGLTLRAHDQLAKANIQHAILMELSREGTGLRLTLAILGSDGARDVGFVRAGDGDVTALAQGVVDRAVATCGLAKRTVSPLSLGSLHPYASALALRATPDQAAAALADALPITALTVSAAATLLAAVPAKVTDATAAIVAARALRDGKRLDELGGGTDAPAAAAKALAALQRSNRPQAEQALVGKRHGLVTLAHVALAENGSDRARFEARIKEGLLSDQVRPVLAIAASLVATSISPGMHKALVIAAEKHRAPGVATRIGLNAAEAGVEVARALELVSARELEVFDLTRLETLLAKRTDPTALRLRAELSMRRADGLESAAISAYLASAPQDPRAHRYHGWALANDGKHPEAAAAFAQALATTSAKSPVIDKAGVRLEQARSLLAAGDPKAALVAIGGPPKSPEELVIAMHVSLLDKNVDVAVTTIGLAEQGGPINPIVHRAIVALDAVKPDPERVTVSRVVLDKGTGVVQTVISVEAGSGSATQAVVETTQTVEVTSSIDTALIEPWIAKLTGLSQLRKRTLVLAQIRWEPAWHSFKIVNAEPVKGAIVKLLSAPPYRLKIRHEPVPLPDAKLTEETLARVTADADAALFFRVAPADDRAHVAFMLYARNETSGVMTETVIKAPGVIGFDDGKLKIVLAFVGVILLGGIVYVTRAKGRIKLKLEKAPDVSDEVLCVEITKSPIRPRVDDPAKFHRDTRAAGMITKAHTGTLIASGQIFKVGVGHWYVHVFGAFQRAGKLLAVPSSCTQKIVIERGALAELKFELTSKLADVRVEVVATPRRGIAVWATSAELDKVYTDDEGVALLALPVGNHTIIIECRGRRFERPLQITSPKQQILSLNIERELRLEQGLTLDAPTDAPVDIPDEPKARTSAKTPAKGAATELLPAKAAKPAPAPINDGISINVGDSDLGAAGVAGGHARGPARGPLASAATAYSPELSSPQPAARALPRAQTPRPGDTLLGRYRIKSELGRGAMGVVHRAWDEKLEREVAIKEMADDLRSNPDAMRLFTQEAKALAQLNHTNIVAMYDQITDASGVYMIMEFVDGKPLADIAQARGAMPWREAVGIVDQVLSGLAYAHARKVIHRDIKPANCFVAGDRTVKLGDFGLARVMREVTIRRTEIRGTPLYMAPEQITGTNVDHRADLYAIGCMLFELVTGRPPFIDGDILYAQMHLPPPLAGSMVEIPAELDELLTALLAKQADDRPGSANEVRTALKQLYPSG